MKLHDLFPFSFPTQKEEGILYIVGKTNHADIGEIQRQFLKQGQYIPATKLKGALRSLERRKKIRAVNRPHEHLYYEPR